MTPDALHTADDVDALARALYGERAPLDRRGVIHVTALYAARDGALHTLRIGPQAPKSAHDFFALQLTRARADAIVITGQILRDEPELRYALPDAFAAWRARHGRNVAAPKLLVLTSGNALDLTHPALAGEWASPVIFTGTEAATRLRPNASCTVVGHPEPSMAAALAWLRDEGAHTIAIEAGPSTTRPLYDSGSVDQLVLSIFRGPVADAARGPRLFANEAEVWQRLGTGTPPTVRDEGGGTWSFQLVPGV